MKKNQLVEMIRQVVSEEIKKQLPKIVSEMFIRNIVSEHVSTKNLREEENFDDYVPQPLHNEDEGIYQEDDFVKSESSSIRNKLLSNDNPMRALYEGVDPSNVRKKVATQQINSVPLKGLDFDRMTRLLEKSSSNVPMKQTAEAEMRRIESMRAALDSKK